MFFLLIFYQAKKMEEPTGLNFDGKLYVRYMYSMLCLCIVSILCLCIVCYVYYTVPVYCA